MSETKDGDKQSSDYVLFKYRVINKRLLDSLVMSHMWCAEIGSLNDPLDCKVDLHEACRRAATLAGGERKLFLQRLLKNPILFDQLERSLQSVGICSFSLELESLPSQLCWTHYADEHRGVCLTYRFPENYFKEASGKIIGVSDITYAHDAVTNWLKDESPFDKPETFLQGLGRRYFSVKSPAWEYEREVRVISRLPGLVKIPFGCLEQVCFGLQTTPDDMKLIEKLAREHCGCKIFGQMIRDSNSDFGIRAVEIFAE